MIVNARRFALLVAPLAVVVFAGFAASARGEGGGIAGRSYVQTNLVSDVPGLAAHTDPNLRNPWGTSVGPGSPIWVSDNAAGVTTLYDGAGNARPLFRPHRPPGRALWARRPGRRSTPSILAHRTS